MTAWPESRGGGGFLAAVAARAEAWLLEPAVPSRPWAGGPPAQARPVIAVIGLAPRCGTTTVARALAVELACRDGDGAAIVTSGGPVRTGGVPVVATAGARRLARALLDDAASPAGRLCLLAEDDPAVRALAAERPAPLVLDVRHGQPPEAALALSDAAVLVAGPEVEPALVDVVAASLTRDGAIPLVVLNRAVELDAWPGRDVVPVGEARLGARLALAGRDPTPGLSRPMAELADRLVGESP